MRAEEILMAGGFRISWMVALFVSVATALLVLATGAWAAPREDAPRVVGYFPFWKSGYAVEEIPGDRLTHLNYAFAKIEEGRCAVGDAGAAEKQFAALRALKARYPHLKTLISVGGWSWSPPFSEMAMTAEGREKFARSCADFVNRNGFDGVDIDWEFPGGGGVDPKVGRPEDTRNFTLLMKELRARLDEQGGKDGRKYLLTFAGSARQSQIERTDLKEIEPVVDFVNVMTYDFVWAGSPVTGHNAPLYAGAGDGQPGWASGDAAVREYVAAGVPAEKVVLGIPFYGRAFAGVKDAGHGLYQKHAGEAKAAEGKDWSYRSLVEHVAKGGTRYWDERAKVPWLFDPATGVMVTYDDPESVRLKARYAREHHLGGVMFWELTQDDAKGSLLGAIGEGLGEE